MIRTADTEEEVLLHHMDRIHKKEGEEQNGAEEVHRDDTYEDQNLHLHRWLAKAIRARSNWSWEKKDPWK